MTNDEIGNHVPTADLTEGGGKQGRLVVASTPKPPPVKRHGYDQIGGIDQPIARPVQPLRQGRGSLGPIAVLEAEK